MDLRSHNSCPKNMEATLDYLGWLNLVTWALKSSEFSLAQAREIEEEVREIQSHKCWLWKWREKAMCQGTQVNSRSWGWLTDTSPQRNGNFNPRTAWYWIWLPTWINVEADSSPASPKKKKEKRRKACWHLDFSTMRLTPGDFWDNEIYTSMFP